MEDEHEAQPRVNEAGAVYKRKRKQRGLSATMLHEEEATRLQIDAVNVAMGAKAVRTIYRLYGLRTNVVEALCIVWAYYQKAQKRFESDARSVGWSGAAFKWKAKMYRSIEEGVTEGVFQYVPRTTGKSLEITRKGEEIISSYCRRMDELRQQYFEEHKRNRI